MVLNLFRQRPKILSKLNHSDPCPYKRYSSETCFILFCLINSSLKISAQLTHYCGLNMPC